MENPSLVEQIRSLASGGEPSPSSNQRDAEKESEEKVGKIYTESSDTYKPQGSRRNELLRAMRPYLSEERGKAIESMITIADILLTMKQR